MISVLSNYTYIEVSNWIKKLSNWIKELFNLIKELSYWIKELRKLSILIELSKYFSVC